MLFNDSKDKQDFNIPNAYLSTIQRTKTISHHNCQYFKEIGEPPACHISTNNKY